MQYENQIRLVVAGGCHVSGWPVGAEHGMVAVLSRRLAALGYQPSVTPVAHVALHHHHKVVAACVENGPDAVVLQLGHFELDRTFSSHLKQILRLPARGARSSSAPASPPLLPELNYNLAFRLRSAVRRAADLLTLHTLASPRQLSQRLEIFIGKVREVHAGPLLVLSPLSCADAVTFRYRLELAEMYRHVCSAAGVHFLDLIQATAGRSRRPYLLTRGYFADNIHLGRLGHLDAGEAVADAVAELLAAPAAALSRKCGA